MAKTETALEDPVWVYAVTQAEAEGVRWARLEERAQTNRLTEAEAALVALRDRGWVLTPEGEGD